MRMGVRSGEVPRLLRQAERSKGGDYRLQQIAGEGKPSRTIQDAENIDMTDALRVMLSVLHEEDLFSSEPDTFQHLLEYHIDRGLTEIGERLNEGIDAFSLLLQHLTVSTDPPASTGGTLQREEVERSLEELAFKGTIIGVVEAPRLNRYTLKISDHSAYERLKEGASKFEWLLGLSQGSLRVSLEGRDVLLEIPRPRESWKNYGLADLKQWSASNPKGDELVGCPGVDVLGNPFWLNLSRAHVFVAGTTGSGKSSCIHSLLCSIIMRMPPQELQFVLIDPKQVEFRVYRGLPHLWRSSKIKGVLVDPDRIRLGLEELCLEMEKRYSMLDTWGVRDFDEALATGHPLSRILIVVDELADLILQIPMAQEPLERLAQKSRACGIHLLLATQRPDARTFSGILRSNIGTRIALGVQRASESQIILGETGAEGLLRPGDMLISSGAGEKLARAHGVYLATDDIAHAVRAAVQRSTND
jgi:S-DNA-T family DNA segregation ATPase FtsK/SpoIIIE